MKKGQCVITDYSLQLRCQETRDVLFEIETAGADSEMNGHLELFRYATRHGYTLGTDTKIPSGFPEGDHVWQRLDYPRYMIHEGGITPLFTSNLCLVHRSRSVGVEWRTSIFAEGGMVVVRRRGQTDISVLEKINGDTIEESIQAFTRFIKEESIRAWI